MVPREVKGLARGKYGRTPAPISPEFREMILGAEDVITHRPADDIAPQLEALRAQLIDNGYSNPTIEDVLSHALFPDVALSHFRKAGKCGL